MGRALTISDELYERLTQTARSRGLQTIEQLLELWEENEGRGGRRDESVARIDAIRERLRATHGEFPDSTELMRQDRDR